MENRNLTRAKVGIILSQPFFATLMMRRRFLEDANIQTACTNGKDINYNAKWFDSLTHDERMTVICHELLHITLLHHIRRGGRDIKNWNVAADYSLNPLLKNSGFRMPQGALIDSRFSDMSAEAIYKILAEQNNDCQGQPEPQGASDPQGEDNSDPGGMGGVYDAPATSESELAEAEAQAKQELAQAVQIAKQQGKLPAHLERLVTEILQPKIAWQETLARFLCEVAKNDYSFSRPNHRYLSSGFIMPSLYNIEVGEIVLMVDTSGSIDEIALNWVASEMQDICPMLNSSIKVLYIDSKVQGQQDIEPDEIFTLDPKGGGGTDFRPGFDWLTQQGITPKAVVYFTDLCCSDYPEEPEFPVLWAKSGGYPHEPVPFGEVIEID